MTDHESLLKTLWPEYVRVKAALGEAFDTGNSLPDAFAKMLIEEDGHEFELALMNRREEGKPTMAEFIDRLRVLYVAEAITYLDHEEEDYADRVGRGI